MSQRALGTQFQGVLFGAPSSPRAHTPKPEKVYGKRAGLGQGAMIRNWGDHRPPEVKESAIPGYNSLPPR